MAENIPGSPGQDMADPWSDWLTRHGAALVLLAKQYVPSRADAEDVVQEAFIRFWKLRQGVADPTAYLFASVKHCALDWQRRLSRRSRREEVAAQPGGESFFASALEQSERQAVIEAALAELPEPQREVLVLKIWGGLTFPQIGEALTISTNTAASRYRYALARLHEQLAEESIP